MKKIIILNGDMNPGTGEFTTYIQQLTNKLNKTNLCRTFNLFEMNLHYCTGCWSCWRKTPGRCAIKDDAEEIFSEVINSDLVIFASPLMVGFTSSVLKKVTDRLIVLLHPYIEIIEGECHHVKRYEKYPEIGVLLQSEEDTDEEDMLIVSDIYKRLAINLHSKVLFVEDIGKECDEELDQFDYDMSFKKFKTIWI